MGIRFKCHLCESSLNVKSELALKRGVCPKCQGKFRIPANSQGYSLALSDQNGTLSQPAPSEVAPFHADKLESTKAKIRSVEGANSNQRATVTKKMDRSHHPSVAAPTSHSIPAEVSRSSLTPASKKGRLDSTSKTAKSTKKMKPEGGLKGPVSSVSKPSVNTIAEPDVVPLLESATEPIAEETFYFVRPPSGGEYGPASKTTLEEWIAQRRVTADSFVCKLGESEWLKAEDVFAVHFLFRK